jgi:hexokinase
MAQKVLVVDVGGTHLKILASRQQTPMAKKLIFASEEGEFTRPKAHAASRS